MDNWKYWVFDDKNKPWSILGLLIIFVIPITLLLVNQSQDTRSRASAPNQLEAENGNITSPAQSTNDTSASEEKYVLFENQTVSLTPTSTPAQTSPGPRPAPPVPTGSNVYTVPVNIDKSGSIDVAVAMQSFINSLPNGTATSPTIVIYPNGANYKISQGINLTDKNNMILWGYGARLNAVGPGTETNASGIYLKRSNNIKIFGFRIRGTNELAGTAQAYGVGGEYAMGIIGYDNSNNIEIADNWISHTFGDGIYFSVESNPNHDNWNIHHNLIEFTGRQGIVPDSGRDIYIENNIIKDIAMSSIDGEDERYSVTGGEASLERVYIRNNLFDRWMWFGTPAYYYTCHAFPIDYNAGNLASMHDIYIENNTFQGGCMGPGNTFQQSTQDADISMWGDMPKSNIYIRNNTFNLPTNQRSGWGIRLNNVTNGEVTGNTIPGQTVQCSSCTNVVKQ
jgi:hypothetical protein